jgi:hypothetical protein
MAPTTAALRNQLIRFAPPAIAGHEREGHNWNVGILKNCRIDQLLKRSTHGKKSSKRNEKSRQTASAGRSGKNDRRGEQSGFKDNKQPEKQGKGNFSKKVLLLLIDQ